MTFSRKFVTRSGQIFVSIRFSLVQKNLLGHFSGTKTCKRSSCLKPLTKYLNIHFRATKFTGYYKNNGLYTVFSPGSYTDTICRKESNFLTVATEPHPYLWHPTHHFILQSSTDTAVLLGFSFIGFHKLSDFNLSHGTGISEPLRYACNFSWKLSINARNNLYLY